MILQPTAFSDCLSSVGSTLRTVTEENHPMTPPLLSGTISPVINENRHRSKNANRFYNKTMINGPSASPSELRILD